MVKFQRLIGFEEIFPNEEPLEAQEYLKGGNRDTILMASSFFIGVKNQNSKFEEPTELVRLFFSPANDGFARDVCKTLLRVKTTFAQIRFFDTYSSLRLFELFFKSSDDNQTQTNADFEISMFKAYLVLNTEFNKRRTKAISSTQHLGDDLGFSMLNFCNSFIYSDKHNYEINRIWIIQVAKARCFFNYIQNDPKVAMLYAEFLKKFECADWKEYVKMFLPLTTFITKKKWEAHTDIDIPKNESYERTVRFLENIVLDITEELAEYDFLTLRSKPFYRIGEGKYRIIFDLFVIEMIFKGLYFQFREINCLLPDGDKIKNWRSTYGDDFSEKKLSNEVLKVVYSNPNISMSGEEINTEGCPDYYIRKGSNIIIFESKDFLIPASVKESCDFEQYEKEFRKSLYYKEKEGKITRKAVLQLIENVRRILDKANDFDANYDLSRINIYPILITHDNQYDVVGFNNLLDHWFQSELLKLVAEGYRVGSVQPLTVINIDSLIFHQDTLNSKVYLHTVLSAFHKSIWIPPLYKFKTESAAGIAYSKRMIPFSYFIDDFVRKNKIETIPKVIDEFANELFTNN